jgi:hypothetical protein
MVRRNELACRDGWDRNLWEAVGQEPQETADLPVRVSPTPRQDPPMMPRRASENRASAEGEDVLLSEARIVSDGPGSWEPPVRTFPAGGFDPRTAIFRAREAYRERARAKASAVRQATATEPLMTTGDPLSKLGTADNSIRLESDVELSAVERIDAAIGPEVETRTVVREPVSHEILSARASGNRLGPRPKTEADQGRGALSVVAEASEAAGFESGWSLERHDPSHAPVDPEIEPFAEFPGVQMQRDVVPIRGDLPQWFRSDLPRVCRSCRDYRPSADGRRGWCANAWAFTHSRLVNADEGTPCLSAIGDWWIPADDVWLVAADVSAHGRATPLLDRLVAEETGKRRRS